MPYIFQNGTIAIPHFFSWWNGVLDSTSNFPKATERSGNQIQLTPGLMFLKIFILLQVLSHFHNPKIAYLIAMCGEIWPKLKYIYIGVVSYEF